MRRCHLHGQLEATELAHAQLRKARSNSAEYDGKHHESKPVRAERRGERDCDQGKCEQQHKAEGLLLAVEWATHRPNPPRPHARTDSAPRPRLVWGWPVPATTGNRPR